MFSLFSFNLIVTIKKIKIYILTVFNAHRYDLLITKSALFRVITVKMMFFNYMKKNLIFHCVCYSVLCAVSLCLELLSHEHCGNERNCGKVSHEYAEIRSYCSIVFKRLSCVIVYSLFFTIALDFYS